MLTEAAQKVDRHYGWLNRSSKTWDWANLCGVVGAIYVPRFMAMSATRDRPSPKPPQAPSPRVAPQPPSPQAAPPPQAAPQAPEPSPAPIVETATPSRATPMTDILRGFLGSTPPKAPPQGQPPATRAEGRLPLGPAPNGQPAMNAVTARPTAQPYNPHAKPAFTPLEDLAAADMMITDVKLRTGG